MFHKTQLKLGELFLITEYLKKSNLTVFHPTISLSIQQYNSVFYNFKHQLQRF